MNTSSKNSAPWAMGIVFVILVTAVILALTNRSTQSNSASSAPPQDLIARVARHIVVKKGEPPSIATIQDPKLLQSQNPLFYKEAQIGDRLLVWSDKVVLYSPSRDLLLAVVNLNQPVLTSPSSTSAEAIAPTTPTTSTLRELATIEVRNGSGQSGMAKSVSEKLKAIGMTLLPPGDAKAQLLETIIVTTAGKEFPKTVQALQELLHAKVEKLPTDETLMKSDILVIVGSNYQP